MTYKKFRRSKKGASLMGYALILSSIGLIAGVAVSKVGFSVKQLFENVAGEIESIDAAADGFGNQAPTAMSIWPPDHSILEGVDTSSPILVATINLTDDGFGENQFSLEGADAAKFSIIGTDLFFSDGMLDFDSPNDANADNVYELIIDVDDTLIEASPDLDVIFILAIMEKTKILASDGAAGQHFGEAVALDGTTALIGARNDSGAAQGSGAAYLYDCSGSGCIETSKLTASDGGAFEYFGWSVSLDGNMALIGARRGGDLNSKSGAAYLFNCPAGICTQTSRLIASDAATDDYFGDDISFSGNYALIGAYGNDDDGESSGAAYLFDCPGGICTQTSKLTANDAAAGDSFGRRVSLSGNYALISAHGDSDRSGSAYLFDCTGGICTQSDKLNANDTSAGDTFASSVFLAGHLALIGAPLNDANASNSGAAYLFDCTGGTCSQISKLIAHDGAIDDIFGSSVGFSDTTAVVGAMLADVNGINSGTVYGFYCPDTGGDCIQTHKVTPIEVGAYDYIGQNLSLSEDNVLVGAFGDDDNGSDAGAAYFIESPPLP